MALFFLLVGLEIKREVVEGSLSQPSQVALPIAGAVGGMIVPAALYVAFNWSDPLALRGWAIPAATDIAFSLGVLAVARQPRAARAQGIPDDARHRRRPGLDPDHRDLLYRPSLGRWRCRWPGSSSLAWRS